MNSLVHQPDRRSHDPHRQLVCAFAAALAALLSGQPATAATSVSKNGITWNFSSDRPAGQYANGDWWVVGPVTITAITPASGVRVETLSDGTPFNRVVNGTVINPSLAFSADTNISNGFDNAVTPANKANSYAPYSDGHNKAPSRTGQALVCPAGTSVVSSISRSGLPASSSYPQIDRISILTVVSAAPPSGSFRPPPTGTDKTHRWNKSQLNYTILKKLTPVSSTPALSTVEDRFAASWTTFHVGNSIQSMSPAGQMPNYGRDQAYVISDALLSLHLNYTDAQKEKLYIALVQYGIDIYGFLRDGGLFRGNGGLNCGHKAPLVLAAVTLNDNALKEWASGSKRVILPGRGISVHPFLEDSQLWYVTQSDVGRTLYTADGRPRDPYTQQHVGLPEWGSEHGIDSKYDGSNWSAYYRDICGSSHVGNALGISLLSGGEAVWNNQVFFDYCDRYWAREGAGSYNQQSFQGNTIQLFHFNMLKAYSTDSGAPPPVLPPISTPTGLREGDP
jgi:hypothetical protein